jgi:hypothetical protein
VDNARSLSQPDTFVLNIVSASSNNLARIYGLNGLPLATVKDEQVAVRSAYEYGNVLWAEMRFEEAETERIIMLAFMRYGDQWFRVDHVPAEWGGTLTESGDYLTLEYHESERAFFEGLGVELNRVYQQAARDFGIDTPMPLRVAFPRDKVAPSLRYASGRGKRSLELFLLSPYLIDYRADPDTELRDAMLEAISYQVIAAAGYQTNGLFQSQTDPLVTAILLRQYERAGFGTYPAGWMLPPREITIRHMYTLEEIITNPRELIAVGPDLRVISARVLLDVIVERGGDKIIPAVLRSGSYYVSQEQVYPDWLSELYGSDLGQLVPAWRARYITKLREMGYIVEE